MRVQVNRGVCLVFMLLLMLGASTLSWAAGPFGFEYGMSKEQITDLIGKRSIKPHKKVPNLFIATTAPNPHPTFGVYLLVITPEKGLIKITAVSRDIKTNGEGEYVKSNFKEVQQALVKTYGNGKDEDWVKDGSKLTDPKDWMKSLDKKDRELSTLWEFKKPRNHIETIALEARALNAKMGFLMLSYEFEGFGDYVDSKHQKEDSVF